MAESNTITILVVDDEPDLLDNIQMALEVEDYNVLVATDGHKALSILEEQPVQLILADIAMPNLNGYQLYERVRENTDWAFIPFIFLTARTMDSDVNYGKELGADDYLTKPIRAADLLAVVRGNLRRMQHMAQAIPQMKSSSQRSAVGPLQLGILKVDASQHRVWIDQDEVKLSAREFSLLEFLAQNSDRILSPQELVQVTHDLETDHVEAGALLRPLILALRRKLGSPVGDTGLIENVRGVGYRLVVPEKS